MKNLLALLIPVLFFALLEGGLRVAGYGGSYPLFVDSQDADGYRLPSSDVAKRYFSGLDAVPRAARDYFLAEKPANGYRVVMQGGSSAAGYPYFHGAAPSRRLERILQTAMPERTVEVINTAMPAVNSYTLADLADEIVGIEPDAVLVYAGHNEYYGALGVGSTERVGGSPAVVRTYLTLRRLRTVQLLRNVIAGTVAAVSPNAEDEGQTTLMERMVGEQVIPFGSELYEQGIQQLDANLSRLLEVYTEAGIPVYLATLASNERDQFPFASALRPGTDQGAWSQHAAEADAALTAGDTLAALSRLRTAVDLDSTHAGAQFRLAALLDAQGRQDEAEARYRRARDLDQLRFRAPSAFNEVIRRLADEYGATLVDVEDRLAEADGGVIGAGMMLEHLHPTLGGYALMTDAFSEALGASARAGAEYALTPAYTQLDSLAGDLRIRRLMGGWPFQPLGTENRALDTLRLRTEPERLARELIDQEGLWERHTRRLMQWHNERRQTAEIARTGLALAQAFPFDHQAPFIAASALAQAGQREEALRWAERSSDVRPSAASELLIGNLLLDQGAIDDAIPRLQAAINIGGDSEEPLFRLGTALVFAGDFERAGPVLNRLLVLNPGHEGGRELLKAISG